MAQINDSDEIHRSSSSRRAIGSHFPVNRMCKTCMMCVPYATTILVCTIDSLIRDLTVLLDRPDGLTMSETDPSAPYSPLWWSPMVDMNRVQSSCKLCP